MKSTLFRQLSRSVFSMLLFLLVCGCANPTEAYLEVASTSFADLAQTWSHLKKLPNQDECAQIGQRLDQIQANLSSLKPTKQASPFHEKLLAMLELQRKELSTKKTMSALADDIRSGKRTREQSVEEFEKLFEESKQNSEIMLALNKELNTTLDKMDQKANP